VGRREGAPSEEPIPQGAEGSPPNPTNTLPGHFLDLRTLAFALTDKSYTLASACEAFGIEHGKLAVEKHGEGDSVAAVDRSLVLAPT
jgi:hypothetical protein